MHVLIIGAAGMLGRKLGAAIGADGRLGRMAVTHLTLADAIMPERPPGWNGELDRLALDIAAPGSVNRMLAARPDVIIHLAAVVSGEAEADFDKGYRVNLEATRTLFETIRTLALSEAYRPRVVFASSIAVFGPPMPDLIDDDFLPAPLTSYGTQKAIGELLLQDYTRRGFLDGLAIRLPTICVRPGTPNRAASGFFSSIVREPLAGRQAILPVPDTVRHWHASPRAAVGFFARAASMDLRQVGPRRVLNMPGVSATVEQQIEALRSVAGEEAVALIRRVPDPDIISIVSSWPRGFKAERAGALGFRADESFDDIIRVHIADDRRGAG